MSGKLLTGWLFSPTVFSFTLKVLNFWKFTSYCSLQPLWSGMREVVSARTLHPPSPPTVHQLSRLALFQELKDTRNTMRAWVFFLWLSLINSWNIYHMGHFIEIAPSSHSIQLDILVLIGRCLFTGNPTCWHPVTPLLEDIGSKKLGVIKRFRNVWSQLWFVKPKSKVK